MTYINSLEFKVKMVKFGVTIPTQSEVMRTSQYAYCDVRIFSFDQSSMSQSWFSLLLDFSWLSHFFDEKYFFLFLILQQRLLKLNWRTNNNKQPLLKNYFSKIIIYWNIDDFIISICGDRKYSPCIFGVCEIFGRIVTAPESKL